MLKIDSSIKDICHGNLRVNISREGPIDPKMLPIVPAVDQNPIKPPSF
jgi:hypothetical protein